MTPVTDPALLSQLESKPVTDPNLLSQLEGNQPENSGYLQGRISAVKGAAQQAISPEFWKGIGHELTNWPQPNPAIDKQLREGALNIGLTAGPITPMSSAMRTSLAPAITLSPKQQAFQAAQKSGYVVPPSEVNPSLTNTFLESISGKAGTRQGASLRNAPITENLIRQDLGVPEGTQLSSELLKNIRDKAGNVYEKAKKLGTFSIDNEFRNQIGTVTKETSPLRNEVPELLNEDIRPLVKAFQKKETLSAPAVIDSIKELRSQASDAFSSGNKAMGRAKRSISDALEGLIERNIDPKSMAGFLDEFKNARQTIAKTYTAEKAINSSSGAAQVLARELMKGKPLSGGMKQAAEFAKEFPKAAQKPEVTGSANVSKLSALLSGLLGGVGGTVAGGPGVALGLLPTMAPAAARSILFSKPYQSGLAINNNIGATSNPILGRALAAYLNQNPKQQ